MRTGRLLAAVTSTAVLVAGTANAQVPSLDLRNFHPPTDPEGSLYLEPSTTPGPGAWNVGAWLSYSNRSVTLETPAGDTVAHPVDHQLSLDYLAGLGIGDRLAVGLSMPTVLYQEGDNAQALAPGSGPLPHTALGDMGFSAKATLVPTSGLGGFGLAALGRVTAPTGNRASYVSDGAVSGELRLLGELKLILLDLRASAGAHVRSAQRTFVGKEFGHELPWAVGLTLRPQALGLDDKGRWLWTVETRGQVAITPSFGSGAQSPALVGVSARYTVGDVSGIAGVELPMDSAVGSPRVRGVLGIGWAPHFYDEDKDGIADDNDECPELAEDKDGYQDGDGCPEYDNDDDGVPDDTDQCPAAKEDEDGYQDDDGCPDLDNDRDGVPDTEDACPDKAGPDTPGKRRGCPEVDTDKDGILDRNYKCPKKAEDKDGFQDEDGCPDLDNDRDRIRDSEDACPDKPGPRRSDPELNGCPSPDKDGDTYDDKADKCPDKPEDFDGDQDDDGCPDDDSGKPAYKRAKPLITIELKGSNRILHWRIAPAFTGKGDAVQIAPKTLPTIRAMAEQLNMHPAWVVMVGVRPRGTNAAAQQQALNRSFLVVNTLRSLTHRDQVAESIGWSGVSKLPGAGAAGIGVMLLGPPPGAHPIHRSRLPMHLPHLQRKMHPPRPHQFPVKPAVKPKPAPATGGTPQPKP